MKNYIPLLVIFTVALAVPAGTFLRCSTKPPVQVDVVTGPVNFWFLDCLNKVW